MLENLEELAYQYCNENFFRPTITLLMRKFKINFEAAEKLSAKVRLRNHLEARKLAKEIENNL